MTTFHTAGFLPTLHTPPAFGFETSRLHFWDHSYFTFDNTSYQTRNFIKVLGYLPVIGTVIGVFRIIANTFAFIRDVDSRNSRFGSFHIQSIVRGTLEFFALGPLLLIGDIVKSILDRSGAL